MELAALVWGPRLESRCTPPPRPTRFAPSPNRGLVNGGGEVDGIGSPGVGPSVGESLHSPSPANTFRSFSKPRAGDRWGRGRWSWQSWCGALGWRVAALPLPGQHVSLLLQTEGW